MKTSSAKAKGRNLQKWVCERISILLNIPWGYEDDRLIQPRIMGQSGTDVVLRGCAKDKFIFDVECKATEKFSVYQDIKQAENNSKESGREWLLVHKKNREDPIIIMNAYTFFNLLRKIL